MLCTYWHTLLYIIYVGGKCFAHFGRTIFRTQKTIFTRLEAYVHKVGSSASYRKITRESDEKKIAKQFSFVSQVL